MHIFRSYNCNCI